jgi:hypothetical protein
MAPMATTRIGHIKSRTKPMRRTLPIQIVLLAGLLLVPGCIAYEAPLNAAAPPQMGLYEARQNFTQALQQATVMTPAGFGFVEQPVTDLWVTYGGFSFRTGQHAQADQLNGGDTQYCQMILANPSDNGPAPGETASFAFSNIKHLVIYASMGNYIFAPDANRNRPPWLSWKSLDYAKRFVDALAAIKFHTSALALDGDAASFAAFRAKATVWRALASKPALSDQARRCELAAREAQDKQDLEKGADCYEQALATDPLWPEGQLQAAQLYGQLGVSAQAALHMKRYLELGSPGQDAADCRGQMSQWEDQAHKGIMPAMARPAAGPAGTPAGPPPHPDRGASSGGPTD